MVYEEYHSLDKYVLQYTVDFITLLKQFALSYYDCK